jgi:L-threonylcarbamoyladenylate synthase
MVSVIDVEKEGVGSAVRLAVEALKGGGLAVLPTDTVYGLAASVHRPEAVRRIFAVKGRQSEKSLVVMVASTGEAAGLVAEEERDALKKLARFWPGKLTIVIKRKAAAWMDRTAPGRDSLGLRVPDHPLTLAVLALTGPLAVTSANRSGGDAPVAFSDVPESILEMADVACFSRHPGEGVPSTVVEAGAAGLRILRQGSITLPELEKAWRGEPSDRPD